MCRSNHSSAEAVQSWVKNAALQCGILHFSLSFKFGPSPERLTAYFALWLSGRSIADQLALCLD